MAIPASPYCRSERRARRRASCRITHPAVESGQPQPAAISRRSASSPGRSARRSSSVRFHRPARRVRRHLLAVTGAQGSRGQGAGRAGAGHGGGGFSPHRLTPSSAQRAAPRGWGGVEPARVSRARRHPRASRSVALGGKRHPRQRQAPGSPGAATRGGGHPRVGPIRDPGFSFISVPLPRHSPPGHAPMRRPASTGSVRVVRSTWNATLCIEGCWPRKIARCMDDWLTPGVEQDHPPREPEDGSRSGPDQEGFSRDRKGTLGRARAG